MPLAWDDEAIDDPTARPHIDAPGDTTVGRARIDVDAIEDLLYLHPRMTAQQIADRLAVKLTTVQQCLKRAARQDLLDQLRRNYQTKGLAA